MPKLVIIFGTGSHNTELMAKAIQEGAAAEGIDTVLKNVNDADNTDVADADAVAIGSPNYNHAMMPTVRKFLKEMEGIDLSGKVGLSFGSYGWSFEATDEIPTSEEIGYLLAACDLRTDRPQGARNKAFLSTLEELGARIGGIGPLRIRDIIFDDIGALISITDKTMRGESVRIIKSVPALKAWLDIHPLKNDPDAPLWVNLRGKNKLQPMDYQTVRIALRKTVDFHNETAALRGLPKIERRIHFHAFRYYAQARDALAGAYRCHV